MDDSNDTRAEGSGAPRARPRRAPRVRAPVALLAIALASLILVREWPDVAYFFSPREPIELGREGDYRFERLTPNRYVQLQGTPTRRAAFGRAGERVEVAVGLLGTPIIVRRAALPSEDWPPGFRSPPPPDQAPLAAAGRLLPRSSGRYPDEFRAVAELGELQPRDEELWMVVDGDRPQRHWPALLLSGALLAFIALNVLLVVRELRRRRSR